MSQWGKSKTLRALSQKKDFNLLKDQAVFFSYKWLKVYFYGERPEVLKVAWRLPKKYVSHSVVRNRLKRWGRENLRKSSLSAGLILMVFLQVKDENFYKKLKRKDFDLVFYTILEKICP